MTSLQGQIKIIYPVIPNMQILKKEIDEIFFFCWKISYYLKESAAAGERKCKIDIHNLNHRVGVYFTMMRS